MRDVLATVLTTALTALTETRSVIDALPATEPGSAAEAVAVVAGIEQLRSSLTALDASWQVTADQRIRESDARRGVPEKNHGHSTSAQLALARRMSPHASSLSLTAAKRLVSTMPATVQRLAGGALTAQTVATIMRTLDGTEPGVCSEVDDWIDSNIHRLDGLGTRRTAQMIREVCHRADPSDSRARAERAARARHVVMHPLDDGMARISATLRALDAAAIMAKLSRAAESRRAAGARDSHQALQADHLVDCLLAAPPAAPAGADPQASRVRLDVGVILTERALLSGGADDEIARIEGYGPLPAHIVCDTLSGSPPGMLTPCRTQRLQSDHPSEPNLITSPEDDWGDLEDMENAKPVVEHEDVQVAATVRRLYTHPRTGELVAMESTARAFPVGLRRMIRWRDETCRTPWCNARIRHIDHVVSVANGGPTSYTNGQGLCARCNYLKEHGLWHVAPAPAPAPATADAFAGSHTQRAITWHSPHGATGHSPVPHTASPRAHRSDAPPPGDEPP